ncbi:hypothetical protein MCOR27_002066 [Pyricularia oryzae]|uniref:Holocytochrome c-type synthase n=2 Tax=Pyricularia TaxID=48558 RepID=A0ABQ8NLX6_PYRGI|nr:hypothetical protein MCOR01_003812 [Pyricularia oryzae]KAI6299174.1 hypothetical protein MCOR33_004820 [Pyricularia grisea]KAH9427334.1 hypothetical protein MCOR02_012241 [Pyricularia oryzae]KAI6260671.1 hypothetical protein MCOR19_003016 [Pyricularia oryzae]KAI6276153.1 hypothetical protein MCOR26_005707 [Pyricularia oryzae]
MADSSSSNDAAAEKCPVDHKSREVWLQQARAAQEAGAPPPPMPPHPMPPSSSSLPPPQTPSSPGSSSSWNPLSWRWSSTASQTSPEPQTPRPAPRPQLDEHRVVSSIPRSSASPSQPPGSAAPPPSRPVNHEIETGADPRTGNWIYPSEKMFFEALKRKGTAGDTQPVDMRTVVPIHNAVNERAWKEIKEWEAPYLDGPGGNKCGGPKLESFSGLAAKMTPRARLNTLLGYTAPFDRHDWVVDRCGKKVEYVIDFYAGRPGAAQRQQQQQQGPQINFYLDVRPKLNSWEGVKMRVLRFVGAA